MDVVKTTKANRWCLHIKDFAAKNGLSYREAMRSEACKTAYKTPEPLPPEPLAPLSLPKPEVIPEKTMEIPKLERSEPIQPKAVKKIRVKRRSVLVPT